MSSSSLFVQPLDKIPGVNIGVMEQARVAQLRKMQIDAITRGYKPASLINLQPFVVTAQGVLLHEPKIPGVSLVDEFWDASLKLKLSNGLEIPFQQHVIANPEFTVGSYTVGGELDASEMMGSETWWPISLAQDIVEQQNRMEQRGGVFAYEGNHLPMMGTIPHIESGQNQFGVVLTCHCNACVQKKADEAYDIAIKFHTTMFNYAQDNMTSGESKDKKRVKPMHKWCTEYLLKVGVLKQRPSWLLEVGKFVAESTEKPLLCDCGTTALPKAYFCGRCNRIVRPFEAYRDGKIELDTPGAEVALRQCSKDQLIELGIYPDVLPYEEFRALRDAERTAEKKEKKPKNQ